MHESPLALQTCEPYGGALLSHADTRVAWYTLAQLRGESRKRTCVTVTPASSTICRRVSMPAARKRASIASRSLACGQTGAAYHVPWTGCNATCPRPVSRGIRLPVGVYGYKSVVTERVSKRFQACQKYGQVAGR